jgi:hypothetical protein
MARHISKLRGPPEVRHVQKECSRMKYPRKVQEHGQGEQRDKASQRWSQLALSLMQLRAT